MSQLTRWGGQTHKRGFPAGIFLDYSGRKIFPPTSYSSHSSLVTVSTELLVASNINAKWVAHLLLATNNNNNRDFFFFCNEIVLSRLQWKCAFSLPAACFSCVYLLFATLLSSSRITWNIKFVDLYGGWDLFPPVIYLFFSISHVYKILTLVATLHQSSAHRSVFLLKEALQ